MKFSHWPLLFLFCCSSSLDAQFTASLTVPKGHKNEVRNCYFTPNDKYLISTDFDHVLCIWDGDDGRQIFTLQDSAASFSKIEISQSGSLIAALTDSGRLYLIYLNNLKTERVQDHVRDFSMQKKLGLIYFIADTGGLFKYVPGTGIIKKLRSTVALNPVRVLALSATEACVQEPGKGILILNEATGRSAALPLPLTGERILHDFHGETGYILCSVSAADNAGVTYFKIEAKSRTIKARLKTGAQYRNPSCVYTGNNDLFLATGISEDSDGFFVTKPPVLYSFKTGQPVSELGNQFIYEVKELNLNFAKKSLAAATETVPGMKFFRRYDLVSGKTYPIFSVEESEADKIFCFACANNGNKVAIFSNDYLLPGIFQNGIVGVEGMRGIKKQPDQKIHFYPGQSVNGHPPDQKIGFLAEKDLALNDSVIFTSVPADPAATLFEARLYYLRNMQVTDSLSFLYEHLSNPLQGSTHLIWARANRFYVLDIATRKLIDSVDLPPHIIIRKLSQSGSTVQIERNDSLANPAEAILVYDLKEFRIRDTISSRGTDMLKSYEELNYSHRAQGYYFRDLVMRDFDAQRNSLFEYPYFAGLVDTVAVLDSTGEINSYQVIQEQPYLRVTTEPYAADSRYRDIAEQTGNFQIGQVRYWDKESYVILTTQNKLLLYSMAFDSVLWKADCTTDRFSRLFPLRNKHMLISNKNRNDSYILDPGKGVIIAHIKGFLNPLIHQSSGFLLLEDAAFGNYHVYRETDYGLMATVTSFSKTDFVVNTPSGLFDGTDKAIQNLYFLVNDISDPVKPWKTIDLNQLKAKYYIPGLWEKLIRGDSTDLPDVESIKNLSMAPEITTDTSFAINKPFKVSLTDKGGGIGAVRVLINGKEVIADARKQLNSSEKKLTLMIDLSPYKEYFSGANNTIQVFSSNADSSLVSRGAITNASKTSATSSNPRLFVVSIGTSNYKGSEIDLRYSSKDAADIAKALQTGARNLFGADSTITYLMGTDVTDSIMLPSKINIDRVMKEISKIAKPKDVIVLYLSGHGINAGGDFYYLTRDAYTANASAYIFREVLQAVAISSKEFTEYFKHITARKQLLIIDACASGQVVENLMTHRDIPYSTLKALDRLKDRTGTHIITGCAADAVSYEASRYGQGLLTYSLLEGMKGASLRENKFLDVMQWFQYARERVPQLADGLGGIQTPQVYSPSGNQSFDIALLSEEDKKKIPLAEAKPVFIKSIFQDEEKFADQLQIGRVLDNLLTDGIVKKNNAGFIFFPVDDFPGAYQVIGRYAVKEGGIMAKIKIFKSGTPEPVADFSLLKPDSQTLAISILEKITELK